MPSGEEEIEGTTFRVYLYMMKSRNAVGPRDVVRGANLSSPSVAYRHLQKLLDLGLVEKDAYGNYTIKEKTSPKGFLWIGRTLIPRLMLYAFFFFGTLISEISVLSIRFIAKEQLDTVFILLIFITAVSAALFFFEGYRLKRKMENS